MKALLGRKIGMSQMFSPEGEAVPVTLIASEPNDVVLRREEDRDGYAAVQLGLPRENWRSDKQPAKAHKGKTLPSVHKQHYAARREFRVDVAGDVNQLTVEQFKVGDVIEVIGVSKGKGFQGVVKRHGFKGGPASHGHRHELRSPGSIGTRFPQHVFKGKRMAGRMGADRVTVKNLSVVWVDAGRNLLAVKGAVPGTRGSIVAVVSTS
jgi:large subunit ribosomal protein L3